MIFPPLLIYHCNHEYPQNHPHCGNFQDQEVLRTADCVNGTTLPFSLFPSPTTRFTQVHYLNNHPHMITMIIISWWTCSMTTGTNTSWTCRTECPVFLGAPTCLLTGTSWFTTGDHYHFELSILWLCYNLNSWYLVLWTMLFFNHYMLTSSSLAGSSSGDQSGRINSSHSAIQEFARSDWMGLSGGDQSRRINSSHSIIQEFARSDWMGLSGGCWLVDN